jgi:hypothetical protein
MDEGFISLRVFLRTSVAEAPHQPHSQWHKIASSLTTRYRKLQSNLYIHAQKP